jgi:nucleoside-diphosphate-sugar epimerase/2-polyprenyl-3-methyl-5-hydroxy-6-metoxy-1,4-benzoquinol methylase
MHTTLITGGTGFIGSRLALACAARGEQVRVLAQRNTPAERQNCRELEQRGITIVEGSITNPDTAARACEGVEVVYHLAAAQHEANVPDKHYYDVNVEGTRNLLQTAVRTGVRRFVHGSTIGVYGINNNGPVRDDSPLNPDNIYGITKLEGEKVTREFFEKLPVAIVRISETYGPGDRRLLKLFEGIQKRSFFHIGDGRNLHHVVYIDDLLDGLRLAATEQAAVGNTFVLAGPRAVTTDEMIAYVCRAANVSVPRLRVPLWPLMATAVVLEGVMRPLGIQPPLHRRRMNFFIKSFQFSCDDARELLGYEPKVDVEEGIRRTHEWYRQTNLLPSRENRSSRLTESPKMPATSQPEQGDMSSGSDATSLSARMERFDSFWEGPEDVEKGYRTLGQFYRANYLKYVPADKGSRILVISCGPGYFVNLLNEEGYTNVLGIDSHAEKIAHALRHGLNCKTDTAFEHLQNIQKSYDAVICEQELNHLTKDEMVAFLRLVWSKLNSGGTLICHGLNGANPIVGAETLAQNFDHFNTFTAYSLRQVLEYTGFKDIRVFGLHLYVFYKNPMNYVAWAVSATLSGLFRALFIIYGKSNRIFTKKIAAVAVKG